MSIRDKITGIDVNQNIKEWPKHLRTPGELMQAIRQKTKLHLIRSPIYSKLTLQFVGSWAHLLVNVLNRTTVHNRQVFSEELFRLERCHRLLGDGEHSPRPPTSDPSEDNSYLNYQNRLISPVKRSPLITFSNHISCIDDPVIWAALLPFTYYTTNTETIRWSPAAIDICFSKPWHSTFFSLGKTFPIVRGIGLNQPAMEFASALLKHCQWLHMFPEGRVMRDHNQQKISNVERGYIFKWGLAKLILDYFNSEDANEAKRNDSEIRILPFYHLGMDEVLPIGWPYIPKFNRCITIYIRPKVIEMNALLLDKILAGRATITTHAKLKPSKSRSGDEIARIKLTNYLEEEIEKLVDPANRLHSDQKQG